MSTLTTIQSTDLITNSRADINGNFAALNSEKLETSVLDTDTTLAANSDSKVPTQKAVKAYVDGVGVATASTTVKGIAEVATQAEVDAGTATGGTGASLIVTPATLKAITTPVVRTYLAAASPATWTKPSGLKYVVVEVQAAGGNGGDAAGASNGGGGGGAGGYSRKLIAAASLGTTETVTIGAVGNSSSFGSHCSATAGSNGTAGSSSALGGAGGTGSGGDINAAGGGGGPGSKAVGQGGVGGSSFFGSGGAGTYGNDVNGNAAGNYGGGGGGASTESTGTQTGGAGGPAIVIVTEYYV